MAPPAAPPPRGSADRNSERKDNYFLALGLIVLVPAGQPGEDHGPDRRLLEVSEAHKPARTSRDQHQRPEEPDHFISSSTWGIEKKKGKKMISHPESFVDHR